jgi:hypothetical protein
MRKLKVLIDCRSLDLRQAKGLENFAATIIESVASEIELMTLDVCKTSLRKYEAHFAGRTNLSFVHDPVQGFVASVSEKGKFGRFFSKIVHRLGRISKRDLLGRRPGWARKLKADVVYYPSHRDLPQHDHLPMVSTIHAVLPEYGKGEMAVLEAHIAKARAIVTSWPHPFGDLLGRYPEIIGRAFLVPYTASHIASGPDHGEELSNSLTIEEPYLFLSVCSLSAQKPPRTHRGVCLS